MGGRGGVSVWVEDAGEGVWLTGRGGCDACQRVRAPIVGGQAARGRRKAYVEGDRGGVGGPTLDIHVWFLTVVRFSPSCVRAGRRLWAKGHGVRDRVGVPGKAWRYRWSVTGVGSYFEQLVCTAVCVLAHTAVVRSQAYASHV